MTEPLLRIGPHAVGPGRPCFVIAEIGTNHNGKFDRAIELIDVAIDAGADCVKFQMRTMSEVYRSTSLRGNGDDLSVEYTLDLLHRFELTTNQHRKLRAYCNEKGIVYLCTPWDLVSLKILDDFGVEAFKLASADLTNIPLLDRMAATGKPLICSTGMSTLLEIEAVVAILNSKQAQFALLHCQSTYPAAFHNINLRFMERLRRLHPIVGYSGHERGTAVTIAAVARGACIVERHITLDRNMDGPDHAASLEPPEFKTLVAGIRSVEQALGAETTGKGRRPMSQGELINRENLGKSLVASRDLEGGTIVTNADILVRSPGQGLSPIELSRLVGTKLLRSMKADDYFHGSDVSGKSIVPRPYRFTRPWGVPVRYHDALSFAERCNPDIVEFHLSYSDMDRNPADYLSGTYEFGFVVHAPELLADSKLMDLATDDEDYRRFSIRETQRVIGIARSLKRFFPKTERPQIVTNIGGFSMDAPIPTAKKPELYETFVESLRELDLDGVEIIVQTMAPFPWHFGGQRFQNLFIFPDECAKFCTEQKIRMCVDVSHTKLAANYFNFDFLAGIATLGPHTAHYHLGDAEGVDGEGKQVGEGEIDFEALGKVMARCAPDATFIPEIWQGHKNFGEGFWTALERLEPYL